MNLMYFNNHADADEILNELQFFLHQGRGRIINFKLYLGIPARAWLNNHDV